MPWIPELFSAPALQAVQDRRRLEAISVMPYFDGLLAGEVEALVGSFAGEPELHDPIRGRIRGARALTDYMEDMVVWMHDRRVTIEDVSRTIRDDRGCEEVLLREGDGAVHPYAMVADHPGRGLLTELRLYYPAAPRPPLLQPDPALAAVAGIAEHPCAVVNDGRVCAVEYNAGTPPHAVLTVRASDGAVRRYGGGDL
ncbi:nuclear transport factor 2 family protein [Baekduia sp. Peel2402]|uniref:nuclear transport factor 2 family protein n=1 Tax=Baekduia sp. Peel2402 TaxID=3458296 RepID=UPI00403EED8E